MDYEILRAELTNDPLGRGYAQMDKWQCCASLHTQDRPTVRSRFLSLRALAAVMSDVEYGTFKAFLAQASQASPRVADMAAMLAMPCADDGSTGGLDFGSAEVRAMVDMFGAIEGMADAATRVKDLAAAWTCRATELGLGHVEPANIDDCRQ